MLRNPFMQASATRLGGNSLVKTSKLSFNGIITNLEKTVSTINQVVPLYNQVRPLINNSKTLINAFKSTSNKMGKKANKKGEVNPPIIDANITKVEQNETQEFKETIFNNTTTPNKPFFI